MRALVEVEPTGENGLQVTSGAAAATAVRAAAAKSWTVLKNEGIFSSICALHSRSDFCDDYLRKDSWASSLVLLLYILDIPIITPPSTQKDPSTPREACAGSQTNAQRSA
jgi:hypothetical protein